MTELRTVAVVGAGLAGGKTVEALRAEGYDGRIILFGDEPHRPYERPPLSKGYLQGNDARGSVFVHPEGWYAEHDVDLRLSVEVTGLDGASSSPSTASSAGAGPALPPTRLMVEGSTGGAGLRGLEKSKPTPLALSVLYFDEKHQLKAYDDIQLGGTGESNVTMQRNVIGAGAEQITPTSAPPS